MSTLATGVVLASVENSTAGVRARLRRLTECEPTIGGRMTGRPQAEMDIGEPVGHRTAREKRADDGPTKAALHGLVRGVLEVLDGRRPAAQLRELFDERAYDTLLAGVATRTRTRASRRLRRLYSCLPADGVVELCATVDDGPRVRAAAARLERHGRQWRCTQFCLL